MTLKTAQYEPTPERYGRQLYYDATYHTYSIEDWRERDDGVPSIVELGPIGTAVRALQHRFGLSSHAARQAVLTAFDNFNDGVNLEWLVRVAATETPVAGTVDPAEIEAVASLADDLGARGREPDDEEAVAAVSSIRDVASAIADTVDRNLTELRADLAALSQEDRAVISRRLQGLNTILARVKTMLEMA